MGTQKKYEMRAFSYLLASHSAYFSNLEDGLGDVTPMMFSPRRFDSDFSSFVISESFSGEL